MSVADTNHHIDYRRRLCHPDWSDKEIAAIEELAKLKDLSQDAVVRQAVRHYQLASQSLFDHVCAVPAREFRPEDRRFYWWRAGPDGHWLQAMIRDGKCLMAGFSEQKPLEKMDGEFWPIPMSPPSMPPHYKGG
jgi:hypothetical protein